MYLLPDLASPTPAVAMPPAQGKPLHKKAVRIVKKKVLKKAMKEYRKAKLEAKKNGLPPPEPPTFGPAKPKKEKVLDAAALSGGARSGSARRSETGGASWSRSRSWRRSRCGACEVAGGVGCVEGGSAAPRVACSVLLTPTAVGKRRSVPA
jgi:hypothetical protein